MSTVFYGGSVGVTLRLYDPSGKLHEFSFASEEALFRVLANECVQKLRAGEPFFVLRGQDASASHTVRMWAHGNVGTLEERKYLDALHLADTMSIWPGRRSPT